MDQELSTCVFCRKEKPVNRLYQYPSKHLKPDDIIEQYNIYNNGDYFTYLSYCSDCGEPKNTTQNPFSNFIKALRENDDMFRAYKDNIAMAFKDNFDKNKSLHENANIAANNFLENLIR